MEFKGTKEKWKYEVIYGKKRPKITVQIPIKEDYNQVLVLGTIGEDDCTVASCCYREEHANALLISKALEMLEFINEFYLMCIQKTFPTEHELEYMAEKAEKLIKEATEL